MGSNPLEAWIPVCFVFFNLVKGSSPIQVVLLTRPNRKAAEPLIIIIYVK
jgi:hypothetical protein